MLLNSVVHMHQFGVQYSHFGVNLCVLLHLLRVRKTMTTNRICPSTKRITVHKILFYVFVFYIITVGAIWFRSRSWSSRELDGEYNDCATVEHPLLCIFTTFKPSSHKQQVEYCFVEPNLCKFVELRRLFATTDFSIVVPFLHDHRKVRRTSQNCSQS